MKEEGIIKKNTLVRVKTPKKSKTVTTVYTEAEIKTVLKAVTALPRERALVELFLDSGIRLEFATLGSQGINFRTIVVYGMVK